MPQHHHDQAAAMLVPVHTNHRMVARKLHTSHMLVMQAHQHSLCKVSFQANR
jgi:hypothetical protein